MSSEKDNFRSIYSLVSISLLSVNFLLSREGSRDSLEVLKSYMNRMFFESRHYYYIKIKLLVSVLFRILLK